MPQTCCKHAVLGCISGLNANVSCCHLLLPSLPPSSSCRSASVESGLREQLATAQRILRLAQLCRKHELAGEGAAGAAAAEAGAGAAAAQDGGPAEPAAGAPEGSSSCCGSGKADADDDAEAAEVGGSCSSGSGSGSDALAELGLPPGSSGQRLLAAFTRRMNAALLDRAALDQERLRLGAENATLRVVVAAVKAGTSVGAGAVDDPLNTLLVVNGRLQKELGGAAAQRRAIGGGSKGSGDGGGAAALGATAGLRR